MQLSIGLSRARGGIGRRDGLRIHWRNPCRFDPCRAHHFFSKFSRRLVFQVEPELVCQFMKTQMRAKTVLQMKHRTTMDANHHMRARSSILRLQFHQIERKLAAAFLFFHRVQGSLGLYIFKFPPRLVNSQFFSQSGFNRKWRKPSEQKEQTEFTIRKFKNFSPTRLNFSSLAHIEQL